MITKICSICKKELNINNFYKSFIKIEKNKCKKCMKIYSKNFYLKNKDKIKTRCKRYYLRNKKLILKQHKIYRQINREMFKKSGKKYYERNKYNPKTIYRGIKLSAKRRNIKFLIIQKDFIIWYNKQEKRCHYCERTLEDIRNDKKEPLFHKGRLTIDRKDNNGVYKINNIVLSCMRCNFIKHNYFTEKQMLKIGKIIYKIK